MPSYGRMYKTLDTMVRDWEGGKDFKSIEGPYCSIRDLSLLRSNYDKIYLIDLHTNVKHEVNT